MGMEYGTYKAQDFSGGPDGLNVDLRQESIAVLRIKALVKFKIMCFRLPLKFSGKQDQIWRRPFFSFSLYFWNEKVF